MSCTDARAQRSSNCFSPPVGAFAVALSAVLLLYITLWSPNFNAPVPGGDYLHFYLAARIVRDGEADRLYDFDYQLQFQNDPSFLPSASGEYLSALYIYPPFFVWFCQPFALLPFKAGAIVWLLSMTACLFGAVQTLVRATGPRSRATCGYALLASLLFTPTLLALYSCQNATLSLLLLAATYALLRAGRPAAAGALFALLAFKPQLTLVIAAAMLWKRQWRFLGGALLGGLVLVAASLAVSPVACARYLELVPTLSRWIDLPNIPLAEMSSWRGFWRLLLVDRPPWCGEAATFASALVTLVPLAWSLRGPLQPTSDRFALQFAGLVVATVLLSPHLLAYDLTLLLLPLGLALSTRPAPLPDRAHDPVWLLAGVVYAGASVSRWIAGSLGIQVVAPLLLVYLVALARLSRPQPARDTGDPMHEGQANGEPATRPSPG